jgi:hypothetical protein
MQRNGFGENPSPEILAQRVRRVQVHFPAQGLAQLLLHLEEPKEPGHVSGFELDEHVYVTLRTEVVP